MLAPTKIDPNQAFQINLQLKKFQGLEKQIQWYCEEAATQIQNVTHSAEQLTHFTFSVIQWLWKEGEGTVSD